METEFAWQVPISSETGLAHWMEWSPEFKLVKPACGRKEFNTMYAEIIPHAKFCGKCQEALSALERKAKLRLVKAA